MSRRRAERTARTPGDRLGARLAGLSAVVPVSPRVVAGLLAVVPVAGATLYRVAHNAPGPVPAGVAELAAVGLPTAVAGPAVAALVLAALADAPGERVGLAFAGGFGLLAIASPAAWYPAAAGTVCGGALAVAERARRLGADASLRRACRVGVGAVLATGVGVSLAASAGVAPATLRPIGSVAALVGIGLTPALVGWDRASLAAGALAGGLTFGLATSAPYVAGAVMLVGGGVVDAPLGLVAFAVAGGVAGIVRGGRRRRPDRSLGAGLVVAAGVPGTLLGALGVVVALALLADGGESA
ncbi:hypothetical protein [Halorussus marinus]|uniref:hypothetical protein n=1 Tax=Halorussus marinus TaxID=2505976 RepID=UPI001092EC6C|nr:hypothetical protein [Halorussus marinus]